VTVSTGGGAPVVLNRSWTAYRWDVAASRYLPETVSPVTAEGHYEIYPEYPAAPQRWIPAFLMMRWPSSDNALVTFQVQLFREDPSPMGPMFTDLTHLLPVGANSLTLRIDNSPPVAALNSVRFHPAGPAIAACEIVEPADGDNCFDFQITAHDPAGHLSSYTLQALWGVNQSQGVASDSYAAHVNEHGPHLWNGPGNVTVPSAGWAASADCAHTFILDVWKRTIDGYNRILHRRHHQSVTLANTAAPGCS
jgi:hypothetical protein